jgi:hypothetical protein
MNPRIIVGLSSLIVWVMSIVQTLSANDHRPVATIYLILGIFLFTGKRWAYRGYKWLLWLSFIVSLVVILLVMPGVPGVDQLIEVFTIAKSKVGGILILVAWMTYSALVLYYLDTDKVRIEYDIDSRKKEKKTIL